MARIVFGVEQLRRSPARYRFFAHDVCVWFGDEEQVQRFNSDWRYAESHELRAWPISHGDFENARTAAWIAEMLNVARSVARGGRLRDPEHELLRAAVEQAVRQIERAR